MTDTELLEKKISDSGLLRSKIMEELNIKAYSTLRDKVEGRTEFTASEIVKLCELLHLDFNDREAIFFAGDAESHSA